MKKFYVGSIIVSWLPLVGMDSQIVTPKKSISQKTIPQKLKQRKDLRLLSLFSGCGGMDLGFEGGFHVHKSCINPIIHPNWTTKSMARDWLKLPPTRFKTVFANDIRPGALKAWTSFFEKNFGWNQDLFHPGSIVNRVKKYWDGEKSLFPKNIDIVTGGFPCQDFSIAGKRKGFASHKSHTGDCLEAPTEENRGELYIWMREVIDIVRPKVFVAENVKGLISLGDAKDIIQNDFQDIGGNGYLVTQGRVLHSAEYGVPQSRERVFFLGFRKDALKQQAIKNLSKEIIPEIFSPFPIQTHSQKGDSSLNLMPFVPLRKIFKGLPEPENAKELEQKSYSKAKWYGSHCQGNREIDMNKIGPTIRAEHHGNIEFRRLSQEHGGCNAMELEKGLRERRLTIRECCRIQTFPDSYSFLSHEKKEGVSTSEAYKLIGNAVPPLLAYHIAKRLEYLWTKLFLTTPER